LLGISISCDGVCLTLISYKNKTLEFYLSNETLVKSKFRNIKRLDIIKGAGHCPHDEEPEITNELIFEFLQETK